MVGAVVLGTILNPLNSSMIAVALVAFDQDFHVSIATATWLVSAFYLTGAVAQPLMGRLADVLGPRQVFLTGVAVAGIVAAGAPLAPSFGWLIGARVVQALATSVAYPSGLGLIRAAAGGRVPAQSLAMMSVAGSVSAALGPTIGGLAVAVWGWRGVFLVNLPITVIAVAVGLRWLPATPPSEVAEGEAWRRLDLPGVLLFAATLTGILGALMWLGTPTGWVLLAVVPVAAAGLALRELRFATPFFDLRLLAANGALTGVFAQFGVTTFVFYSFFFGIPIWLEQVRGFGAREAGLLILPITGLGILATPLAARIVSRRGPRVPLVVGSAFMLAGSLLLLAFGPATSIAVMVAIAVVIGVPNGFNNMGLQAALYEAAPRERTAWAGGQFQTFRYVGAVLSSTLLAFVFGTGATTAGLHNIALILAVAASALLVASAATRRSRPAPLAT